MLPPPSRAFLKFFATPSNSHEPSMSSALEPDLREVVFVDGPQTLHPPAGSVKGFFENFLSKPRGVTHLSGGFSSPANDL
jgi:hypothetical protein